MLDWGSVQLPLGSQPGATQPLKATRSPHSHQGSGDHRKWGRGGVCGPLVPANPFSLQEPSHQDLSPLQHPDPHDPNPAFPKLCTSPTTRKVHKDLLTPALLSPTRAETPIPQLGSEESFSLIFWELFPSPALLQNSFLSWGLFSLLPHKGLTLACFEWSRRQH